MTRERSNWVRRGGRSGPRTSRGRGLNDGDNGEILRVNDRGRIGRRNDQRGFMGVRRPINNDGRRVGGLNNQRGSMGGGWRGNNQRFQSQRGRFDIQRSHGGRWDNQRFQSQRGRFDIQRSHGGRWDNQRFNGRRWNSQRIRNRGRWNNGSARGRASIPSPDQGHEESSPNGQSSSRSFWESFENENVSSDQPPSSSVLRIASKLIQDNNHRILKNILPGYKMYFGDNPPSFPEIDKKVQAIDEYYQRQGYSSMRKVIIIDECETVKLSYDQIIHDAEFNSSWPDFPHDLLNFPIDVLNLWGAVMQGIIVKTHNSSGGSSGDQFFQPSKTLRPIRAAILKSEPCIPIRKISSSLVGKLVSVRGQVVSLGSVKACCLQIGFKCKFCEKNLVVNQPDGIFTPPTACDGDCDNKKFFEMTPETELLMDYRRLKLQDGQTENGERGKIMDCEIYNGMVNMVNSGDNVTITAIVKKRKEEKAKGEMSLHNIYLEIVALQSHNEARRTAGGHLFSFTDKDYCAVSAIFRTPELFKLLVASFCPTIYGHGIVKASLLLSLLGGGEENYRNDINVLILGDPGLGKSQMLKVISSIAPRGVYVCGTGTSACGLTATMIKEGQNYVLEPGALVLADNGVCCIDEFEKMVGQHPALLESMEQQTVTISKSGVYRTLSARTTVIAAANPVDGHYNKYKTLLQNIKISLAILSRFDLIFILHDRPNKRFDTAIVSHILGNVGPMANYQAHSRPLTTLQERLRVNSGESLDLIPHSLMRKYIAYARQYVKPSLSQEAISALKGYYLSMRDKHSGKEAIPITTRQLESLVRLTQARAKLELRETATIEDAQDVIEIFEASLYSSFDEELLEICSMSERRRAFTQTGTSLNGQAKKLINTLQKTAFERSKTTFTYDEIKDYCNRLRLPGSTHDIIDILNVQGFLLKKGGRVYEVIVE